MRIKQLVMTNFRQFAGTQTLDFAADDQQNVTIIMGQNGAGKTGLFRAVLFALFGDIHLSQDTQDATIQLINEEAMRQAQGRPTSASVHLSFLHGDGEYTVTREVRGRFDGRNYHQGPASAQRCELTISQAGQDPQVITDSAVVNQKIEAIIRRDIREFFFFDAESLQILADLGKANVRDSVKAGIFQLLQVQDLESGRDILKGMKNRVQREIRNVAKDNQTQGLQQELNQIEGELANNQQQLDGVKAEITRAESELADKQQALQTSAATRELMDQIDRLQEGADQQAQLLEQRRTGMARMIQSGATQLFDAVLPDISQQVAALRRSSNDNIPKSVLEQSLRNDLCALCGHALTEDSQAQNHIQELLRLFKYSQSAGFLTSIEQGVAEVTQHREAYIAEQGQALTDYAQASQHYRHQLGDLDGLKNQLHASANDIKEFQGLAAAVQHIKEDLSQLKNRQEGLITRQTMLEQKQQELKDQLTERVATNDGLNQQVQSVDLMTQMEAALTTILQDYSDASRVDLQTRTLQLFKQLIAAKDQQLIAQVEITGDYQIKVYNQNHRELANDLSQGEKQILSLAFIMALAQIAANGRSEMAFPLFMDTPFARIDGDNRDRLIDVIPTLTQQWVLLLTDTEFTSAERDQFMNKNCVGATYRLLNVDGNTTINAVDHLSLLELRGENNG
ncbi:AAA family ATPase (plasmid) [Lactiplantibacillus plantarum]|uniref:AAA family ATPase n=1 Tax=Lactiplantibacillus plantarum TaxID=1590 RepID=UPI001F173006|nr:AAA family ATPase [Lactiplantibacillus plantarum]UJL26238.1 AAA family ATPase [Lactiplantibacillus plantarum]